jgi:fermentation-respiration switch protein FrsA (DUF1100 family)
VRSGISFFLSRFDFGISFRLIGWVPAAGSALAVALLLALNATVWQGEAALDSQELLFLTAGRVVETILPLAIGLHAAFLLSPEDEESLELVLASPRPLGWVLLERLAVLAFLQGSVGIVGSLIGGRIGESHDSLILVMARWVAPSIFFGGLALCTTILTRKGALSALVTLVLWGVSLIGGDAVVGRIFFLWPLHAFLQPENAILGDYVRNRAALSLLGLGLAALAVRAASDEERMLGVRESGPLRLSGWLRLALVGLVGGALMAYLGYLALWVDGMARPAGRPVCCITPADAGLDYQDVTFTSGDGVTLAGWYIPSKNRAAVMLLHGYGAHRIEMLGRAQMLARHGYGVLLYDLRAHGESTGDARTFGWLDVNDVATALAFLQNRDDVDPERIGILGFSIGGQVALRSAAQMDGIKAVAADGPGLANQQDLPPPTSLWDRIAKLDGWLLDRFFEGRVDTPAPPAVVDVIADIVPRPILLIATGRDMERRVCRYYYAHASEPKALWEIPEAGHGGGPIARPEEYEERIVTFFNQAFFISSLYPHPSVGETDHGS